MLQRVFGIIVWSLDKAHKARVDCTINYRGVLQLLFAFHANIVSGRFNAAMHTLLHDNFVCGLFVVATKLCNPIL